MPTLVAPAATHWILLIYTIIQVLLVYPHKPGISNCLQSWSSRNDVCYGTGPTAPDLVTQALHGQWINATLTGRFVSNWNTWVPPELKGRAPYRPMVHLEAQLSGQDWDNVLNTDQPIVHLFNEPDKNSISPERAAQVWHGQMVPLRQQKGKQLVSPSISSDDNGKNWLADFMSRVSDAPPDFVGLHYYGTDGNACIQYLQDMHSKYSQPIIVSEIASTDHNAGSVWNFTVQLANFMDNTDWIFEYGFFGCMRHLADNFVSPDAQLMKPDGNFTDLMKKLQKEQPMIPPS